MASRILLDLKWVCWPANLLISSANVTGLHMRLVSYASAVTLTYYNVKKGNQRLHFAASASKSCIFSHPIKPLTLEIDSDHIHKSHE